MIEKLNQNKILLIKKNKMSYIYISNFFFKSKKNKKIKCQISNKKQ